MKQYRLNFARYWEFLLFPILKLIVVMLIFTYLSISWFNIESNSISKVVFVTWCWLFLSHILPILIMSIYHYSKSKGVIFKYDSSKSQYQFNKGDIMHKFTVNDISRIVKTVSPPRYDKRADFLGFGYFFYFEVYLLDGTILPISCFILNDEKVFRKGEIELKKKMFPIP